MVKAALASLALCVLVTACASSTAHSVSSSGRSTSQALDGVVGYQWRATRIVDSQGSLAVVSLRAKVGFTRDGYVLGDDTLDPLQANYTPTADGYTVGTAIIGGAGTTGLDPSRERVLAAVDSLFFGTHSQPANTPVSIVVKLGGDGSLTLQHDDVQVILSRAGEQPDFFAQPPSPTRSVTS